MDRYAVVGNPVDHSLSPRIHAAFAAATGEALEYRTLLAPLDDFVGTVARFFDAGGAGLNVTLPFKELAAAWVSSLDPAATRAGAVNTIVRAGGGFRGCNTDGAGLVRDLAQNCGVRLAGTRVLLLGAGGAARGALGPLIDAGVAELVIGNRTLERARALAASAGAGAVSGVAFGRLEGRFDVVINATSAGLGGTPVADLAPALVADAFCYDMIYAPGPDASATEFCRWSAAHGARAAVDGLGMLVEQAALAFELWRGVAPATGPVLELLRRRGV
ncbi:MAG: shikimate dehydrogenase [Pseudomonadales bacterium]